MKFTTSNEWLSLADQHVELIRNHQQKFPIAVGAIAKDFGINVKVSTLPAGISGEIKDDNGVIVIRINRHDTKERQRFTLAHEIAHFLLHRDRIGDGITDDILYRSKLSDFMEVQANRLAADILMPGHLLEKKLLELTQTVELRDEQKIERLAEVAGVSTTAIKIRLGKI
ncbi:MULTISPECIES: ImmA/IrrE family metallo-endopeptidase [Klebsiella]|uniref:ImmA/IrrE family metallo-endopeptidase n=1 Tax=Klebsiella TaxID=570 RepID=UPI00164F8D89|nr:ImmA/IrrE family metallo-endopeptidase [Klebsiella quasipneumoniae]HCS5125476.1 ImmA/IrrE family metallo-endopeptidase [Escherichia coli]EIY4980010.1 ImmA/IrrE family metallo-endopeptidase [Klebsiella quasipneumoniae]EKU0048193.1 ImmA/IrrE family metallo-endopeptidase [Klebsiella quasipneumoniae]EKU0050254.1 ImmA/IrrE family metallo-endopeptidase [Klebsiella quasipneumoniae]EKU3499817.1 ImmA/IrrE family metallo-endopeptidase [Klebsiella quasipneumoniae]